MMIKYVITNGDYYCRLIDKGVHKTNDKLVATVFSDTKTAYNTIAKAPAKLKGYQIVPFTQIEDDVFKEHSSKSKKRRTIAPKMRNKVYEKYNGRCVICGKPIKQNDYTIDHIIPISCGGTNAFENLQLSCKCCNQMKQDFSMDEAIRKMLDIIEYQASLKHSRNKKRNIKKIKDVKQSFC